MEGDITEGPHVRVNRVLRLAMQAVENSQLDYYTAPHIENQRLNLRSFAPIA